MMTFWALVPCALGLPAYSAIKVLASAFYAHKNTKTPVRIAFQAMAINVVLDILLMWKFEVAGLAFATTASAWYQAWVLFALLKKDIGPLGGREMMKSFLYGALAGVAMGALCWFLAFVALKNFNEYARVFLSISVGVLFYFGLSKLLKIREYDAFMDTLLRRKIHG